MSQKYENVYKHEKRCSELLVIIKMPSKTGMRYQCPTTRTAKETNERTPDHVPCSWMENKRNPRNPRTAWSIK